MADELVDWADVAAVGVMAWGPEDGEPIDVGYLARGLVFQALELERQLAEGEDIYEPVALAEHRRIASALREAHEAGREESRTRVEVAQEVASYLVSILPLTPAAIEIMSKELARLQDENRTLRRELAARRAVDGRLREW